MTPIMSIEIERSFIPMPITIAFDAAGGRWGS